MASETLTTLPRTDSAPAAPGGRFVNGMRLNARHWLAVAGVLAIVLMCTPRIWKKIERFDNNSDYRMPYPLSKDYWLYQWGLERLSSSNIAVIGDSVIWGEYVQTSGTLAHFLNEEAGQHGLFVNEGVNGMFPLALEGLIRYYGAPLSNRKILLHCNLLWMSSGKADLHTEKEERFNHAELVPQFFPRIPCYKEGLNHRLVSVIERHFSFSQWVNHLQMAYFGQKSILAWTLEEDSSNPPQHPNACKNPLAQITLRVPLEPAVDLERGPSSPRHKPWSATGEGSTRFEWVALEQSLQWGAFRRVVELLRLRNNDVLVVIGPFNEHIMAPENRPAFRRLRDGVAEWLGKHGILCLAPEPLPAGLYADANHPLTDGYQLLAKKLTEAKQFQEWLGRVPSKAMLTRE